MTIPLLFLIIVNSLTFLTFIYDKISAIRGGRRVSELTLHTLALLGGVYLMMLLMNLIRHKNHKFSFYFVTLIIAVIWLFIVYYGLQYFCQLDLF